MNLVVRHPARLAAAAGRVAARLAAAGFTVTVETVDDTAPCVCGGAVLEVLVPDLEPAVAR